METMVDWTIDLLQKEHPLLPLEAAILDVGTGNGVLPLELASHGFCNLTGTGTRCISTWNVWCTHHVRCIDR